MGSEAATRPGPGLARPVRWRQPTGTSLSADTVTVPLIRAAWRGRDARSGCWAHAPPPVWHLLLTRSGQEKTKRLHIMVLAELHHVTCGFLGYKPVGNFRGVRISGIVLWTSCG